MCLVYNSLHSTTMIPLNTTSTVEEAHLDDSHPWIEAFWTNNRFYASVSPTYSDDHSEVSSNSGTTMSSSSEEATFPEYDTGSDVSPYAYTLTIRGRNGSSNVTPTVNQSDPMQNALDKYCIVTILRHAPKQGITHMIDIGT